VQRTATYRHSPDGRPLYIPVSEDKSLLKLTDLGIRAQNRSQRSMAMHALWLRVLRNARATRSSTLETRSLRSPQSHGRHPTRMAPPTLHMSHTRNSHAYAQPGTYDGRETDTHARGGLFAPLSAHYWSPTLMLDVPPTDVYAEWVRRCWVVCVVRGDWTWPAPENVLDAASCS
jgi:hypothetical protein